MQGFPSHFVLSDGAAAAAAPVALSAPEEAAAQAAQVKLDCVAVAAAVHPDIAADAADAAQKEQSAVTDAATVATQTPPQGAGRQSPARSTSPDAHLDSSLAHSLAYADDSDNEQLAQELEDTEEQDGCERQTTHIVDSSVRIFTQESVMKPVMDDITQQSCRSNSKRTKHAHHGQLQTCAVAAHAMPAAFHLYTQDRCPIDMQ